MLIYSNCNIHDCTWGNRPDNLSRAEREKESEFKAYRTKWLCVWILSNASFAYFFHTLTKKGHGEFVIAFLLLGFLILSIRTVGSVAYIIEETLLNRKKVPGEEEVEPETVPLNQDNEIEEPEEPEEHSSVQDENM
jgi:hypothetical protein